MKVFERIFDTENNFYTDKFLAIIDKKYATMHIVINGFTYKLLEKKTIDDDTIIIVTLE